jgi:hypothetical protein
MDGWIYAAVCVFVPTTGPCRLALSFADRSWRPAGRQDYNAKKMMARLREAGCVAFLYARRHEAGFFSGGTSNQFHATSICQRKIYKILISNDLIKFIQKYSNIKVSRYSVTTKYFFL